MRKLPCDVFLAAHVAFYDLEGKYPKLQAGGANPFVDHAGFLAYIDLKEKQFYAELERQKQGGKAVRRNARASRDWAQLERTGILRIHQWLRCRMLRTRIRFRNRRNGIVVSSTQQEWQALRELFEKAAPQMP